MLRRLRLDEDVVAWIREALKDSHAEELAFHAAAIKRVQGQLDAVQRRMDVAYDDRLDGRISIDEYTSRSNRWRQEQAGLRSDMERHQLADQRYNDEGVALLELAGMAFDLYESQTASQKRRLLDFLCSNSEYRHGALSVEWRKPFDLLAESIDAANTMGGVFGEENAAHPLWCTQKDLNLQPSDP